MDHCCKNMCLEKEFQVVHQIVVVVGSWMIFIFVILNIFNLQCINVLHEKQLLKNQSLPTENFKFLKTGILWNLTRFKKELINYFLLRINITLSQYWFSDFSFLELWKTRWSDGQQWFYYFIQKPHTQPLGYSRSTPKELTFSWLHNLTLPGFICKFICSNSPWGKWSLH